MVWNRGHDSVARGSCPRWSGCSGVLVGTSRKRVRGGQIEPDSIGPRSWNSVHADSLHPGMEQRLPFQGVQLASWSQSWSWNELPRTPILEKKGCSSWEHRARERGFGSCGGDHRWEVPERGAKLARKLDRERNPEQQTAARDHRRHCTDASGGRKLHIALKADEIVLCSSDGIQGCFHVFSLPPALCKWMFLSKPIRIAMPAGEAEMLTSNDQLSRGGNAPQPVVSVSCSGFCNCMHFGDTVVLDLGFTKTRPRKGTESKSRSQTDGSSVCFGIFVVNASLQSVWCLCLQATPRRKLQDQVEVRWRMPSLDTMCPRQE